MPVPLGAIVCLLLTGTAVAQQHPDLSGYWELRYDSFSVPAASLIDSGVAAAATQAHQRFSVV